MGKWSIACYTFKTVRELINEEVETASQCMKILSALETCCDELTPNGKQGWLWYDTFRDMKSEIHDELELMDESDDYEDCEEIVDSYLSEFYDLCDAAKVWCEM